MTNLRKPPLTILGVEFTLHESFPAPYYYAGGEVAFFLNIKNGTSSRVRFEGSMTFEFRNPMFSPIVNGEEINLEIDPGPQLSHGLRHQWLPTAGEAMYTLSIRRVSAPLGKTGFPTESHPIASFSVYDKGVKEEAESHRRTLESLQQRTLYAFIASIIASGILAGIGLYLAFH